MTEKFHRIDEKRLDAGEVGPESGRRATGLELGLVSGTRINVGAIQLYDRVAVEHLLDLRVSAFALLQATPSTLPGLEDWAVTPALLINAVHRHVSPKKADAAERLLSEAESLAVELHSEGRMFPVREISGVESPHPHLWFHVESVLGTRIEGLLLTRKVEVEEERQWIHNGDPFVTILDDHGARRDVRWSAVEQYRVIDSVDE